MRNRLGQVQAPNTQQVIKDFYVYEEDFSALSSGATALGSINIQADSDFVVQKLTYFAYVSATTQEADVRVIPLVTIQITDSGSGRNLMEAPVPISNIMGTGELPFILPQPKLFLARTTISVSVNNFSTSVAYNLRLSLIGYKVFRL